VPNTNRCFARLNFPNAQAPHPQHPHRPSALAQQLVARRKQTGQSLSAIVIQALERLLGDEDKTVFQISTVNALMEGASTDHMTMGERSRLTAISGWHLRRTRRRDDRARRQGLPGGTDGHAMRASSNGLS
jgi:hypothetical protein